MENNLKRLLKLFLIPLLYSPSLSMANSKKPDIRFRVIVYFLPNSSHQNIKITEIAKYFTDFEKVTSLPDVTTKALVSYSIINDFQDTYPAPDINYLSYFGRGVSKEQATLIQDSNLALIADFAFPEAMAFQGIKASSEGLYSLARAYDGLISDFETRELFSPDMWKKKRIESWDDHLPNVGDHIVIHAYKEGEGIRAVTLGMAKFGLPDIVVNNFSWAENKPIGNLINLVAQLNVEGITPTRKNILKVNINSLADTKYKQELIATLKENVNQKMNIPIGKGKWEEGDPENDLIELLFHNAKGDSLSEKQSYLLSSLFGQEDKILSVKDDKLMKEASGRAKQKLNALRKDFNSGLEPGEFIQVKSPFTSSDGKTEWMWVEILSWNEKIITGLLNNEPFNIPELKAGSKVVVNQDDVFDYIRIFSDGRIEGNETTSFLK